MVVRKTYPSCCARSTARHPNRPGALAKVEHSEYRARLSTCGTVIARWFPDLITAEHQTGGEHQPSSPRARGALAGMKRIIAASRSRGGGDSIAWRSTN